MTNSIKDFYCRILLSTRFLSLALLLIFILATSSVAQTSQVLIERAKAAIEKSDFDSALRDLNAVIVRDSGNGEAFAQRSRIFIMQKAVDKALVDAEKALTINPKNATALNVRGLCRGAAKDYDGAITDFTQAIAIEPTNVKPYINRGFAYEYQRKLALAIADFNQALAVEPNNYAALFQRAELYRKQEKCDLALADYNTIINAETRNDTLLAGRAFCRANLGKELDAAFADAEKALVLNPKNAIALTVRGFYKSTKKDYDAAIADLSSALAINPQDKITSGLLQRVAESHPNAAKLPVIQEKLDALKRETEASNQSIAAYKKLDDFFRVLSPKTDEKLSLEKRREINFSWQKVRRDYYLSLTAINDKNVCAYYFAAMSYPNFMDGKELFDKAINNFDGQNGRACSTEAAFWMGRNLAEAAPGRPSDDAAALRYYNRVLELDPQNPNVKNWIAKLVIIKPGRVITGNNEEDKFMAGVSERQQRIAQINRRHLDYVNQIDAAEKKYNAYARERESDLDYTPKRFAELTALMKKEANYIIATSEEALAGIGSELSDNQKQFYRRKIEQGKAALVRIDQK